MPRLGATVTVGFTGPTFGGSHFWTGPILMTGLSRTSSNGVPLPFHLDWNYLTWMGGPDCYLYCSSEVYLASTQQSWVGQVTMSIPRDPQMLGLAVYQQYYVNYFVTGQIILNFAITSDGGVWTIGL